MPIIQTIKKHLLPTFALLIFVLESCNVNGSVLEELLTSNNQATTNQEQQDYAFLQIDEIECIPDLSVMETANVLKVIDGDSIKVEIEGKSFEVRYIGINTPEYDSKDRQKAEEATEANRGLVEGKMIYLFKDHSETDKYDRLLRYVLTDNSFVNLELVKGGFAEAKAYSPDTSCHLVFQHAAN